MKFPEIPKTETLERRYIGKISKKGLQFLKSLLKMEPGERLTTTDALKHNYFEGLYSDDILGSILSLKRKLGKGEALRKI